MAEPQQLPGRCGDRDTGTRCQETQQVGALVRSLMSCGGDPKSKSHCWIAARRSVHLKTGLRLQVVWHRAASPERLGHSGRKWPYRCGLLKPSRIQTFGCEGISHVRGTELVRCPIAKMPLDTCVAIALVREKCSPCPSQQLCTTDSWNLLESNVPGSKLRVEKTALRL